MKDASRAGLRGGLAFPDRLLWDVVQPVADLQPREPMHDATITTLIIIVINTRTTAATITTITITITMAVIYKFI